MTPEERARKVLEPWSGGYVDDEIAPAVESALREAASEARALALEEAARHIEAQIGTLSAGGVPVKMVDGALRLVAKDVRALAGRPEADPPDLAAENTRHAQEREALVDCHAGPGTATPACGVCQTCLHRDLCNALAENTRLQGIVKEQAAAFDARHATDVAALAAANGMNTPLRARVAALEKQLSEGKDVVRAALRERIDATRASAILDMRAKSLRAYALEQALALVEEFFHTPAVTGTTSDKEPLGGQPVTVTPETDRG